MARNKEPEMPPGVPTWLMTFSDVITLLMTFFILLLTFATSEPERFERMQVAMFSGGGALGIAGDAHTALDRDSVVYRVRPRSGRKSTRGSEMPPIHEDPVKSSLADGIAGLEQDEQRETSTSHELTVPVHLFFNADGEISVQGKVFARMLARQLRNQPLDISIGAPRQDTGKAQLLAAHLFEEYAIQPGRIGVGYRRSSTKAPGTMQIRLTLAQSRQKQNGA